MKDLSECKYNLGVDCKDQSTCASCGWDPEVAQRRIQRGKEASRPLHTKEETTYA